MNFNTRVEVSARHIHLSLEHLEKLFGKDYNYLYVMNYHRNYQSFNMQISNMVSPSLKKILKNKTFLIPSTYGFIAPLNMQLSPSLSITFTTSEVLSINKQKDFIELKINWSQGVCMAVCF